MPHTVEYDPQTDIIYIRANGDLTLEIVREYTNTAALLAKETGCFRFLSDLHETVLALSMLDVYGIPEMVKEIGLASDVPEHKIRRAVVLPRIGELSLFFETVSKNRVQNVALFDDVESARKWLLEK